MARRVLLTVGLCLLGVLVAASIGYASYLVSRDEVGLPVTKLEQAPRDVVPAKARKPATTTTRTATVEDRTTRSGTTPVTTGDDHSGRGRGGGSDNSGRCSSGGGGDFDDD
jgi:hypothetical protein